MIKWLGFILLVAPLWVLADARFVEAPAECHFPYDNASVDNEYKLSGCEGVIRTAGGGALASAHVFVERKNITATIFVVDGQDVRDLDAYPGGKLKIATSAADSGTNCNIVGADGTTYASGNWTAITAVTRTPNINRVDVAYDLNCWGGAAQ